MSTEGAVVALLQNLPMRLSPGVEAPSARIPVECNL